MNLDKNRKIVSIKFENSIVIVLCSDDTIWCMNIAYRERGWWQLPNIPQE